MKRFYDMYLSPTGAFDASSLAIANLLLGFDKLEYPKGSKLSLTTEVEELDDGTGLGVAHTATLETTTLKVDAAEYAYLLSTIHNEVCDALLMDANAMELSFAVLRIRMKVEKVAESGGDRYIKISGAANIPNAAIDTSFQVLNMNESGSMGIIEGYITQAGGEPADMANILFMDQEHPAITYGDSADKVGYYLAMLPSGTYGVVVDFFGSVFPSDLQVVVETNQITRLDIQAEP